MARIQILIPRRVPEGLSGSGSPSVSQYLWVDLKIVGDDGNIVSSPSFGVQNRSFLLYDDGIEMLELFVYFVREQPPGICCYEATSSAFMIELSKDSDAVVLRAGEQVASFESGSNLADALKFAIQDLLVSLARDWEGDEENNRLHDSTDEAYYQMGIERLNRLIEGLPK